MTPAEDEAYASYDILLSNGMLNRNEKHLLAVAHSELEKNVALIALKAKNPNQDYLVERGGPYYYISSLHYYPASGSDTECNAHEKEEIEECNKNMKFAIDYNQTETLREAFPEGY